MNCTHFSKMHHIFSLSNNPKHTEREETSLWDIPFVQRINAEKYVFFQVNVNPLRSNIFLKPTYLAYIIQDMTFYGFEKSKHYTTY